MLGAMNATEEAAPVRLIDVLRGADIAVMHTVLSLCTVSVIINLLIYFNIRTDPMDLFTRAD